MRRAEDKLRGDKFRGKHIKFIDSAHKPARRSVKNVVQKALAKLRSPHIKFEDL